MTEGMEEMAVHRPEQVLAEAAVTVGAMGDMEDEAVMEESSVEVGEMGVMEREETGLGAMAVLRTARGMAGMEVMVTAADQAVRVERRKRMGTAAMAGTVAISATVATAETAAFTVATEVMGVMVGLTAATEAEVEMRARAAMVERAGMCRGQVRLPVTEAMEARRTGMGETVEMRWG
jgi:hypothetical protein